jgi:ribonucleoside-diphosphate reductase alpha chain
MIRAIPPELENQLSHEGRMTDRYSADQVYNASLDYFNGDELAADTFRSKYALRDPKDTELPFRELTPADMHRRMAKEFARVEQMYPNPVSEETIYGFMEGFKYIVPQGSPMFGLGNPYVNISLSNCVVVASPKDNMSSIMETGKELANLYKRRAGVGVDLSSLRPDGASVNNSAGSSTGAWSFAELYSHITRMVGQSGRRGALMLTMDIKHPDIANFVTMKQDKTKVTGANVSVKLSDAFMQAVENDEDWVTQFPVDVPVEEATTTKTFKARDLWDLITSSAHKSAEPGLLFWDNITRELPADYYPQFKTVSTNPCSEIPLSEYDSCRLISINLTNFVSSPYSQDADFDYDHFSEVVKVAMRLMDDLVDLEIEALTKIIDKTTESEERETLIKLRTAAIEGRRTGLGTHGLADMLAKLEVVYDSDEAFVVLNRVYSTLRDVAYNTSVDLAKERGAFPAYKSENEQDCPFISRLATGVKYGMAKEGRRNISLLTMAPTGSVSILSQTSSGVEPVFRNAYTRRKKINPSDKNAKVDFTDLNGDKWQEFTVYHHNADQYFKEFPQYTELPDYFVTSEDIDPMERVKVQSLIQAFIDHGISSTINLPKTATVEDVQKIYMQSWKSGLKGVTVYVDGSRSGVLVSEPSSGQITATHAPKRPKELHAEIKQATIDGQKWTFVVGFMQGVPYELFGGPSEFVELPKKAHTGKIIKRKCSKVNKKGRLSCYDLVIDLGDDELTVKDIGVILSPENENYGVLTRMTSLSLRHGVPLHFVVEQLGRDVDSGMHSFSKVMARILKHYIKDGTVSGELCMSCGSKLVFSEGCHICLQCGSSKCS